MANADGEVPETPAVVESEKPKAKRSTTSSRAEALLAKKKKKRAAHRVALRRSNTGG